MKKEYVFEFAGTKEDFLNKLNPYQNNTSYNGSIFYYFNAFIVKITDDKIHFGVERGGHSGGYWFIPTITEYDDHIEFCGIIEYIGPDDDRGKIKKAINKIEECLLYILVAPLALVIYVGVKIVALFKWLTNKILGRSTIKPKTTEEKLFYLMEDHFGCARKEIA